jgi:hypothetical protein
MKDGFADQFRTFGLQQSGTHEITSNDNPGPVKGEKTGWGEIAEIHIPVAGAFKYH